MRTIARSRKSELQAEGRSIPGRAAAENLLGGSKMKHERVSGCKDSPRGPGKSRFHSKSGQTYNGKRRKAKGPLIR